MVRYSSQRRYGTCSGRLSLALWVLASACLCCSSWTRTSPAPWSTAQTTGTKPISLTPLSLAVSFCDSDQKSNINNNKAFIDIRLRPAIATPLATHRHNSSLRANVSSSIKPEVHNVAQRRPRRTEPRPQGICDRSSDSRDMLADRQTHTQTDKQADRNTPLPYRGGVNIVWRVWLNVTSRKRQFL